MKLSRLAVSSFMRVAEVDVQLQHPITVFCGDNDQGKSSIQEAVRLAFTGEAVRVRHKKDWPLLVRNGSKSGSIVVEWSYLNDAQVTHKKNDRIEGRASVALASGKVECHPEVSPAIAFVLDAPRFGGLEDDKRRKFLFDLVGVRATLENTKERLLARGCRSDLLETITPILRSGFDAAHQFAIEKQAEYRAAWKALTGETYGEVKAEKWRAPLTGSEVNSAQIGELQKSITTISKEITDVTKQIGAGEAYLTHKARYDKEAKSLKDRSSLVGKKKKDMEAAERSLNGHRPVLEKAEAELADARLAGQPCPACGTFLAMRKEGKLIEMPAPSKEALAEIEGTVETARSTMRILQETSTRAKSEYEAAVAAAEQLAILERAMGTPMTAEHVAELRKEAAGLEHDVESLTSKLTDLQNEVKAVERAKKATEDARTAHQLVLAWGKLAEAVAPSGVPGDLLEEALGPINKRLKHTAKATGWGTTVIHGDMQITVDGILYRLCGESVRWRSDAMLAEAISHAAGVRMLVLDRFDVLAPERRGALIDWCFHLADEEGYETVLLFGTLKAKPVLEGVNVFWLADGKVS